MLLELNGVDMGNGFPQDTLLDNEMEQEFLLLLKDTCDQVWPI